MRIVQNPESGEVGIQLEQDEKYEIEEHLESLMDFVVKNALETHKLIKSYKELVQRFDLLERKLSEVNKKSNAD